MALITHGRSGSTMLQHALNQSSGILLRGENCNLPFGMFLLHEAASRATSICPHDRTSDTAWFGAPDIPLDEFLERQRETLINCLLRPPAEVGLLGWKEIRHIPATSDILDHDPRFLPRDFDELTNYIQFLRLLLPGIVFLVNTRDPRAASESSWWGRDPARSEEILRTSVEWLRAIPAELERRTGEAVALEIRYETWSRDPNSLKEAWEFLGADWDSPHMTRLFANCVNGNG